MRLLGGCPQCSVILDTFLYHTKTPSCTLQWTLGQQRAGIDIAISAEGPCHAGIKSPTVVVEYRRCKCRVSGCTVSRRQMSGLAY